MQRMSSGAISLLWEPPARSQVFQQVLDANIDAASLSSWDSDPVERWRYHTWILKESLATARRLLLARVAQDDSAEAKAQQLVAAARIVWSGDHKAARAAMAVSPIFVGHVTVTPTRVAFRSPESFEHELAHTRLAALEARDAVRQRLRGVRKRPRGNAAAARLAQLWAPRAPRLVLRGIRTRDAAGADSVLTDAAHMREAIAAHWAPVFCAPEFLTTEVDSLVSRWTPRWRFEAAAPGQQEFEKALAHGRRSAPDPDGLSYDAWRANTSTAATTLLLLHDHLADGGPAPEGLNNAVLAMLPKGSDPSDDDTGVVRSSDKLRPLCLKNVDIKVIAGVASHSMRSTLQSCAHPAQHGFIPGRSIIQNVYELDCMARALDTCAAAGAYGGLLFLDIAAAFPSLSRKLVIASLRASGAPRRLVNLVLALFDRNVLLLKHGSAPSRVCEASSGVPQGCPLSSVLCVLATEPIARFLSDSLRRARGAAQRLCADDVGLAIANVRAVRALAGPFEAAAKAGGLHLKAEKCHFVTRFVNDDEKQAVSRKLAEAWEPAGRFEVCRHAVYLGFALGPQASAVQWKGVCDKFKRKVESMAASSPPVAALPSLAQSRLVSLWRYVGSLGSPPSEIERIERDAWARLLKLPGSSIPLRGFNELAQWGWPSMPSLAKAIDAAARATAVRPGATWQKYALILEGGAY